MPTKLVSPFHLSPSKVAILLSCEFFNLILQRSFDTQIHQNYNERSMYLVCGLFSCLIVMES